MESGVLHPCFFFAARRGSRGNAMGIMHSEFFFEVHVSIQGAQDAAALVLGVPPPAKWITKYEAPTEITVFLLLTCKSMGSFALLFAVI